MTKIKHDRPSLKLIDNANRQRAEQPEFDVVEEGLAAIKPIPNSEQIGRLLNVDALLATKSDIHSIACSVLAHLAKHRDVRLVTRFIDGVPHDSKSALKDWFESFGPIIFDGDKARYNNQSAISLGSAMEMPYWRFG